MNWEEVIKNAEYSNKKKKTAKKNIRLAKKIKYEKQHHELIINIEDILEVPKKNEQYIIMTYLSFNSYTFILYIIEKVGIIEELIITTFNLNDKTMSVLEDMKKDGKIKNITAVISESTMRLKPHYYQRILQLAKEKMLKLAITTNHSKIVLMKTAKDYFVLEGSGNFTDNVMIEQYRFENNKESYEFHKNWIEKYVFQQKRKKRHYVYK